MKHFFLIAVSILTINISFAQNQENEIEINPYIRYDAYKEFLATSRALGDNYVTPRGTSYGLNLNYKKAVGKNYKLLLGMGYYRNTLNQIKRRNTRFPGEAKDREISFLSPFFIPFFTDKHWYNCFVINTGVQRNFMLKNNLHLNVNAVASNYFTFSQYYHLTHNPSGSLDYRRKESKYSGLSATLEAGLLKKINKMSIGPKLLIPIYTKWKTDFTLFDESSTGERDKWFAGVGMGISINYSLTSKK